MLIKNAQLMTGQCVDVLIDKGMIAEMAPHIRASDQATIDADGGALLPGLHDHHIHLMSLAASKRSIACGPPDVRNEEGLVHALQAAARGTDSWIRGIGYHDSIAGSIDRHWLDRHVPDTPARIQHRTGRLWVLNSRALDLVIGDVNDAGPLEGMGGELTGRLYDGDDWLRSRLAGASLDLRDVSAELASYGVTGVTDATVTNDRSAYDLFSKARAESVLAQDLVMMGDASLSSCGNTDHITIGPTKFHLHENDLMPFDTFCDEIRASHGDQRPIAVHCVTRTELVFTLGALQESGVLIGDRIEHASVTPDDLLPQMKQMGLTVVTQPNFISERGDSYRAELKSEEHDFLYRCARFLEEGIPLGGGTDAPFGRPDPWAAMAAAVDRCAPDGEVLGPKEKLTPEQALALFITPPQAPGGAPRTVTVGSKADLCLLKSPWSQACETLNASAVRATFKDGALIYMDET